MCTFVLITNNKPIVLNNSANNSGLVVNGKNGIIIKNGDYFALSNAIIKLKNEKFNFSYSDNYLNQFHDKYGKNNIVKEQFPQNNNIKNISNTAVKEKSDIESETSNKNYEETSKDLADIDLQTKKIFFNY